MKFKLIEDIGQDIETVENNSILRLEFHIYTPDRSNPEADQIVTQLEQRLSAFGAENAEQKNESGHPYSMFRIIGRKFSSTQEIINFFQTDFPEFINLLTQIWRASKNFVRVVVVDESNPPKRLPGRMYTLLGTSDYQDMLTALNKRV
jgi:hypothetical protein